MYSQFCLGLIDHIDEVGRFYIHLQLGILQIPFKRLHTSNVKPYHTLKQSIDQNIITATIPELKPLVHKTGIIYTIRTETTAITFKPLKINEK